jgi:hypothetical protein
MVVECAAHTQMADDGVVPGWFAVMLPDEASVSSRLRQTIRSEARAIWTLFALCSI